MISGFLNARGGSSAKPRKWESGTISVIPTVSSMISRPRDTCALRANGPGKPSGASRSPSIDGSLERLMPSLQHPVLLLEQDIANPPALRGIEAVAPVLANRIQPPLGCRATLRHMH